MQNHTSFMIYEF